MNRELKAEEALILSVLWVDDDMVSNELVKADFNRHPQMRVDIAANAQAAMMKIQQRRYDLIVTDFELREMSGVELGRQIRTDHNPMVRSIPIFLCTGYTRLELEGSGVTSGT